MCHPPRTAGPHTRPLRRSNSRTCIRTSTASSTSAVPLTRTATSGRTTTSRWSTARSRFLRQGRDVPRPPVPDQHDLDGSRRHDVGLRQEQQRRSDRQVRPAGEPVADQPVRDPERGCSTRLRPSAIAISRTAEPGERRLVHLHVPDPGDRIDYPKFGVWPDAYYMSSQQGDPAGASTRGRSTARTCSTGLS